MAIQTWIIVLTIVFVAIAFYPLLIKFSPDVSDTFYVLRNEYLSMQGGKRSWRFIVKKTQPLMGQWLINRFERFLRLAGRPLGMTAQELILLYVLIFVVVASMALQLDNAKMETMLLALGLPFYHIKTLKSRKDRRQIQAEEAIRFLKRRFVYLLNQRIPITEALSSISHAAPGDFGITFRKYLSDNKDANKPLRLVMSQFREEYEVQSLDDFCIAIELSDLKSPDMLAGLIFDQTLSENARMDDFIEKKKATTKGAMILLVALAAFWTMALCLVFGGVSFMDYFRGGGGFLNI